MYYFEASYPGNIGAVEMVRFYQTASDSQIKEMEKIVKEKDWESFKEIINKVLKIKLK